jgi:hypothetical protein
MAEEKKQPYAASKPGDLWTAEIWNDTQVKIKEDIETKAKELKDEIAKNGVDLARDAEKFGGKNPVQCMKDFAKTYAELFALKDHIHESRDRYFRCFKTFSETKNKAIITHGLRCHPTVDVWELSGVTNIPGTRVTPKFFLYHSNEAKAFDMVIHLIEKDVHRGIRLIDILDECGIIYRDQDRFDRVIMTLWKVLLSEEADTINHTWSPEVQNREMKTIVELKKDGDLEKIMLSFVPMKKENISMNIEQLNFETIYVELLSVTTPKVLMFLLRA